MPLELRKPPRRNAGRARGLIAGCVLGVTSIAATPWWPLPDWSEASRAPTVPLRTTPSPPEPARAVSLTLPLEGAEARLWNASTTLEARPTAARPFLLTPTDPGDRGRALSCLTAAIYYEAGMEGPAGQRAVAQVVLNRLRHPDYPKSVCGVVFQGSERPTGCQFTFACDGSLARAPTVAGWRRARLVAEAALDGEVDPQVGHATHYHAVYVVPYWSPGLLKVATIGPHIFYQRPGRGGQPGAFVGQYAGAELDRLATPPLEATDLMLVDGADAPPIKPVVLAMAVPVTAEPATAAPAPVPLQVAKAPPVESLRGLPSGEAGDSRARLAMPREGL